MPRDASPAPAAAASADDRRGAIVRVALVVAAATAAFALPRLVALPGVPMCAFRLWTGMPCPGCGMTRATFRLVHADVGAALRLHPLVVVFAALGLALLAGGLWSFRTGRDPVWRFLDRHAATVAAALVVALLGVWVVRVWVMPAWSPDPIGDGVFVAR